MLNKMLTHKSTELGKGEHVIFTKREEIIDKALEW